MTSWLQLANKTAVVTGAASGIGSAVAKALVSERCHVVIADRDVSRLEEVAKSCSGMAAGSVVTAVECDVASESQVQSLFQNLPATSSPATVLINCAGITRDGWIGRMSVDQWQQVQDVNLLGTFLCCREFLAQPELQMPSKTSLDPPTEPLGGSIVNISSVVATQGNLGQVNYAASKGGVWSMTKALAREVAQRKIRVNCVLPGFVDTEMTQAVPDSVKEHVQKKIVFQQQFGQPDDIANLILFLASCHRSGYITGEAIECSGMISL
ncbi:dichloro-2,5-cyclohexadiene-1,4-diol dehydrogenase [Seminavis robusta]|uniref:Dichloro-2,5-cyclohexadiene-1,4-diol dehydrogenase n=1 Tax=Seminavis robusta TaxID=568900 RepID=A0A9N8DGN4_9STRA|nr:dichloro-2,5-cyclohexadiene-1,4-diol dehydrogenase [Seminavis robusta]|eukprot:Sro58_g033770.1 dichloro-2,5-cyclohexadiene-1,4-diol dehydrogenase (268) ;mRNA; r:77462-78265